MVILGRGNGSARRDYKRSEAGLLQPLLAGQPPSPP
jgi:hypothetical protein